jgi:hypothetical protein
VEARRRPAGRARGGDRIQASRPPRARLIPGIGAVAAAGCAAGYAATLGGRYEAATDALVVVGVVVLVLGLVLRWPGAVPWAVVAIGAGYVIARSGHTTVDGWAALVGVALLGSTELATWSIEHDARIGEERDVTQRRIVTLAALLGGALLLDVFVVASAAVSGPAGVLFATVGVAAAVAAVAVILRLVRAA